MANKPTAYLICETACEPTTPKIVSSGDVVKIKATLQDGDLLNRNKRIYPKQVLENALKNPYVQERLRTKTWYGMN